MATIRSTKSLKLTLLIVLIIGVMVLAGCDVSSIPGASTGGSSGSSGSAGSSAKPTSITSSQSNPDNSGNSGNSDSPGDTPTGTPQAGAPAKVEHALSTNPPITFRYAGIDFTVKKALITNELPHFPGHYSGTDATIYLTLSGTDDSVYSTDISSGLLVLTLDGTEYKQPAEIGIQSRDTQSIDFEWDNVPQTTDWKGATLNINQEGKVPVTVALDNPQPQKYPIALKAGRDISGGTPPMTYTVTMAQIGLDGMNATQFLQADTDMIYVTVKLSVTSQNTETADYFGGDYVTLLADNKPVKPDELDPPAAAITPLKTSKFTAWFEIPAGTKTFVLEVGNGDQTAQIQLTMP
jgi:hypothetical protein